MRLKKVFSNLEPEGQRRRIIMGVTLLLLLGPFYSIQTNFLYFFAQDCSLFSFTLDPHELDNQKKVFQGRSTGLCQILLYIFQKNTFFGCWLKKFYPAGNRKNCCDWLEYFQCTLSMLKSKRFFCLDLLGSDLLTLPCLFSQEAAQCYLLT